MHKDGPEKLGGASNPFQVLEEVAEERMHEGEVTGKNQETDMQEVVYTRNNDSGPDTMEVDEVEDMDLGDLDLDSLEAKCKKAHLSYVPREHIKLLQQAIIQSKVHKDLGISMEGQKGSKRKTLEEY